MSSAIKIKILNALLLVSFLFGYLEWGNDQHSFIFEAEADLFTKFFSHPEGLLHPFILIPFAGQLLIFYLIVAKKKNAKLNYLAAGCLAILIFFLSFIGAWSRNWQIFLSTIPFFVILWMLHKTLRLPEAN